MMLISFKKLAGIHVSGHGSKEEQNNAKLDKSKTLYASSW